LQLKRTSTNGYKNKCSYPYIGVLHINKNVGFTVKKKKERESHKQATPTHESCKTIETRPSRAWGGRQLLLGKAAEVVSLLQ
jgi:hypothetical protein